MRRLSPWLVLGLSLFSVIAFGQSAPMEIVPDGVGPRAQSSPALRVAADAGPLAVLDRAEIADPDGLEAIRMHNQRQFVPTQIGFARQLDEPAAVRFGESVALRSTGLTSHDGGLMTRTATGELVWGAKIRVDGAWRLRLHLTDVELPDGAQLWVYGSDDEQVGPFGRELMQPDGGIWTPSIGGEEIHLEARLPAGAGEISLTIGELTQLFELDAEGAPITNIALALRTHCIKDAQCYGNGTYSGIDDTQTAIALYSFIDGGTFICTGTLLNDTVPGFIPYFLTANHCVSSQSVATTFEGYWDYQSSSCNGAAPSIASRPRVNGATLSATSANTDVTLFELSGFPPGGGSRFLLGWTTGALPNGTTVYNISHPEGRKQSLQRGTVNTSAVTCTGIGRPEFIYLTPDLGGTFGGSSGSALLLPDGVVVGQLLGGCGPNPSDGCNYANADVHGAFRESFDLLGPILEGTTGTCSEGSTTDCLLGNRFKAEVEFQRPSDPAPLDAKRIALTDQGVIWYFGNANNPEILLKMVNACSPPFNRFWVFYAATTNVEFDITVTDTQESVIWTSHNDQGNPAPPVLDTDAFATCP